MYIFNFNTLRSTVPYYPNERNKTPVQTSVRQLQVGEVKTNVPHRRRCRSAQSRPPSGAARGRAHAGSTQTNRRRFTKLSSIEHRGPQTLDQEDGVGIVSQTEVTESSRGESSLILRASDEQRRRGALYISASAPPAHLRDSLFLRS